MYLISAYFDEHTAKQLQRFINTIAEKTGNTYMTDNNVPPHMTISGFEMRKPEGLVEDFMTMKNIKRGSVNIVSVGEFLPYVIYATPVLNQYVLELAESIYDKVSVRKDVTVSKFYQPFCWFPHITLGKKLDKEQMAKAFEAMQVHFMPLSGEIVRLGLAETNPHKDIATIELNA